VPGGAAITRSAASARGPLSSAVVVVTSQGARREHARGAGARETQASSAGCGKRFSSWQLAVASAIGNFVELSKQALVACSSPEQQGIDESAGADSGDAGGLPR